MQHSSLAIAAVVALVAWRVSVRVRRLVGRQRSRLWQHRATVLVLPFLIGLLLVGSLDQKAALLGIASGTAAGCLLAFAGFRRTRFEVLADGRCFYTPFAPIGIGLATLLIARLAYHGFEFVEARASGTGGEASVTLTPTTLFVFATLASYYSAYSFGLLLWRDRQGRTG